MPVLEIILVIVVSILTFIPSLIFVIAGTNGRSRFIGLLGALGLIILLAILFI